ncbi:hypothetical protein SELR_pSRC100300 (plasmid) [Selenomonas ruminantium subsp. lactilytica TAM6421]|uniref:Peptidase S11 D-alanyl-D-alanine carboxypeptidase A N-terminal domain-containing protein n=1 Tax=Selenomonas ruminantium subsp. lactilytica (strain NBRC 103574 / TAM6421) TaxID=927704 RepID=I0GVQ0_SELRL|nr:hypothetical protein SELR_pSRC100300 [Selenomonas ruminantium subsp. lactilytica TAM6421]
MQSYPGCNGIKTGYTRAAQWCLAASAQRDDREYIVVIMHAQSDEDRYHDAAALLDYAFSKDLQE